MQATDFSIGKRDSYAVFALVLLCLVLFFCRLGSDPLWDVDEGKHASTSKDMVLTGDWVTTRLNGENFYDKTVLYNWLAALSFLVFGFTEFAARVPAALLGLCTVLATFLLGRRMFGSRAGLLGGVILATSPEFIVLSRSVVHDISLAFFVTLALAFFFIAFKTERRRALNLVLFYGSLGLAVLAKGPIGLLLPGMIIGLFLAAKGRLDFLREMSPGRGAVIFLAVAAPWYVLISARNEDYVSYFFLKQNLGNFLSETEAHHPEPFYYYVPALVGGMLPWSAFLPLAVARSLGQGLRKMDDGVLFLLLWFGVIFCFFSAANSKLATYILPAFPAAALLTARLWNELIESPAPGLHKKTAWSLGLLPLLLAAGVVVVAAKKPAAVMKLETLYGIALYEVYAFWTFLTAFLIAALLLLLARKYRASFIALAATFAVSFLIALVVYLPGVDCYRSTRTLAREMDRLLPPGDKLVFFQKLRDSALFYTNRRATVLHTEKELLDYLAAGQTSALCVIEKKGYRELPRVVAASSVLGEEGNKLLIAGRPGR